MSDPLIGLYCIRKGFHVLLISKVLVSTTFLLDSGFIPTSVSIKSINLPS